MVTSVSVTASTAITSSRPTFWTAARVIMGGDTSVRRLDFSKKPNTSAAIFTASSTYSQDEPDGGDSDSRTGAAAVAAGAVANMVASRHEMIDRYLRFMAVSFGVESPSQ